jgi:hypothetical protein
MPSTHLLVRVNGGYAAGPNEAEQWSFGIRCAIVSGTVDDKGTLPTNLQVFDAAQEIIETDYVAEIGFGVQASAGLTFPMDSWITNDVVPAIKGYWAGGALCAQTSRLESIQVYPIEGPFGKVSEGRKATVTFNAPINGSGSTTMLPPEVAAVISWQTLRVGPKGRGRIYLPARTTADSDNNGRMKDGSINVMGTSAVELLQGLEYVGGTNPWNVRPIVTGKPYSNYAVIKQVRIGHVFDAQRRRRNQLDEEYSVFPV